MATLNLIPSLQNNIAVRGTLVNPPGNKIAVYVDTNNPTTPNAEKLMKAYREYPEALRNGNGEVIKGMRIDITHINKLIADGAKFKELYVAFAADSENLTYHPNGDVVQESITGFTTIFFGINDSGQLIDSGAADFCDPCPPICPCLDDASKAAKLALEYPCPQN